LKIGKCEKMKIEKISLFLFALLVFSYKAYAVTGYISQVRIISRPDVKIGEINVVDYTITYGNPDKISSFVTLSIDQSLKGVVDLSETFFELLPGEYKNVSVRFILSNAISKSGNIYASFSDGVSSVTLWTEISILPNYIGNSQNQLLPSKPEIYLMENKICSNFVVINWSSSYDEDSNIIAYEYQISRYNDFSIISDSGITLKNSKKLFLKDGFWYYFRVRAFDGKNYSDWSSIGFKMESMWNCIRGLKEDVSFLKYFVEILKSAICSIQDFNFCNSTITTTLPTTTTLTTTLPTTLTTTTISGTTTTTLPGQTTSTTTTLSESGEIFILENYSVICPRTFVKNGITYNIIRCRAELWKYSWKISEKILEIGESWTVNGNAGYFIKLYGKI
jgi:hypothetical protein